jgi:hypothetical protein
MSISLLNTGRTEKFRENWSVAVPTVTTVALWTYIVPSKCRLRLLSFGNYLGTVAAWGAVVWVLLANNVRVPPYEAVLDQIGYAAQRQTVTELEFSGGTTLNVTAYNGTLLTCNCGVSLEWELIYQE